MGSNQSARKLTVSNDEEGEGVIQVSNAIVQRLKQGMQETSDNSKDVRIQKSQPYTPEGGVAPPLSSGYPTYYSEHTISALEMQKRKDAEIDRLEEYWNNRLLNLKKSHMQINQIFDCEYKKAISQYSEDKKRSGNIKPPCMENSEEIVKCYRDHPKESLACSPLVEKFSSCVDQCRSQILTARS